MLLGSQLHQSLKGSLVYPRWMHHFSRWTLLQRQYGLCMHPLFVISNSHRIAFAVPAATKNGPNQILQPKSYCAGPVLFLWYTGSPSVTLHQKHLCCCRHVQLALQAGQHGLNPGLVCAWKWCARKLPRASRTLGHIYGWICLSGYGKRREKTNGGE